MTEPATIAPEQMVKIIEVGARMRRLQREYFRTKSSSVLIESKKAEAEFDKLIQATRSGDLFGGQG